MTLNSIDVKHLTFKYTDQQDYNTLDDLSFHVKQGEWLSIIGHNGSGKSTTVRLIDGLLAAESGQIFVEGELLTEENVWNIRQKIGMVFQNPDNQFVGATVEDDVAFGLENKGIPLEEMKARVKKRSNLLVCLLLLTASLLAFQVDKNNVLRLQERLLCVLTLLFWMKRQVC